MNPILKYISENPAIRGLFPLSFRKSIKRFFDMREYNSIIFASQNPYAGSELEWTYTGSSNAKIGILFDSAHYHRYYMSACLDLEISYQVIDLRKDNWVKTLNAAAPDVIVAWPSLTTLVLKEMLDERSRLIDKYLDFTIFPNPEEIFLLDNKRRVRDWLMVNDFEAPKTWCFYAPKEALDFAASCPIPIVFKSTKEGVSRGVIICRDRQSVYELVKKCFGKGFVPRNTDPRNVQWDFILFQEYLPEVEERRMIRIGDSFLAIDKVRKGDFHSGSGEMKWANPERFFLDKIKEVTEKGGFRSMNVDFFIAQDGRILINELHTMFHGPEIYGNEGKGRFIFNATNDDWIFEEGSFYRNYCCNLRIIEALNQVGIEQKFPMEWVQKPAFEYAEIPNK